jgi:hypothetical protein
MDSCASVKNSAKILCLFEKEVDSFFPAGGLVKF